MKKLLIAVSLLITSLSFGQDTTKTKELNEVQVISVRAEQITPVTQKNLCKDEIQKQYIGQDMSYILQRTPAFTTYSDNGLYNSYTYFRLRGVDQTRINMTLNGIPLNEPEDQGVYFSNYPDFGANISSVQIQRGVGSSSYGSSSYIGSINFESQNLLDTGFTSIETGYGSYNTYRASIGFNSGMKDKVAVYGRYSSIGSDGYKYNAFNDSKTFFTSAGYYGDKNIVKLTAFSGQSCNGMGYLATNIEDINKDPRTNYLTKEEQDKFNQTLISLQWIKKVDANSYFNTSIFYNYLDGNYDVLLGGTMNKFRLISNFEGVMTTYNFTRDKVKFQFGLNSNFYDRQHMSSIYPNYTQWGYINTGGKTELSAFTKLHYNLTKKIVSFIDLQYRTCTFSYHPDSNNGTTNLENITWMFFNPKGGLRFNQTNKLSYYLTVGMNHREPTRNDLFNGNDNITPIGPDKYVGIGGVDTVDIRTIKPERVVDFELGTEYKSDRFQFELNGYYMDFKNEIAQIGQLSYIGLPLRKNVKSSLRSGIELDLAFMPIKGLTISENVNYSYNKIKEYTTDYDSITYKNVYPLLTPNLISNTTISYNYRIFTFGVNGRYVAKSYLDNTQNDKFITPSFFIMDVFANLNVNRVTLKVAVNNVTNQRYFTSGYVGYNSNGPTSAYFVGAPINYYISLNYKF